MGSSELSKILEIMLYIAIGIFIGRLSMVIEYAFFTGKKP